MEAQVLDFEERPFALDDANGPTVAEVEAMVKLQEEDPAAFARVVATLQWHSNRQANYVQGLPQREELDDLASRVSFLNGRMPV